MQMQALQLCEWCLKAYGLKEEDLSRFHVESSWREAELQPETTLSSASTAGSSNQSPLISLPVQAHSSPSSLKSEPNQTLSSDLATDTAVQQATSDSHVPAADELSHRSQLLPCEAETGLVSEPDSSDTPNPPLKRAKVETDSRPLPSVCVACLGLLDDGFVQSLGTFAAGRLQEANYTDLHTFCLSLHMPLSLLSRKTGVELCLKSCLGSSLPLPEETYIKDLLRSRLRSLLQKLLAPLEYDSGSPFQIVLKLDHRSCRRECDALVELWPKSFTQRTGKRWKWQKKSDINNVSIKRALENASVQDVKKLLPEVTSLCSYSAEYSHKPLFIAGRYNKYSRLLPQTPWIIDGIRKGESSVQELICTRVAELVPTDEIKFSSSGREDVDVRMLGSGRPFLLELLNPKKMLVTAEELARLQESINSSTSDVAVRGLAVVSKETASLLKEGEEDKQKRYSALIWSAQELAPSDLAFLSDIENLKLEQKTPIRVLHRRTLATRERTVYSLQGEFADSHHFRLSLSTQAGTYVKEFVHGDFGRTQPNLCSLMGREVDILILDVEEVMLDWPPQ